MVIKIIRHTLSESENVTFIYQKCYHWRAKWPDMEQNDKNNLSSFYSVQLAKKIYYYFFWYCS
jgi:hypothetical protein